ncbi:MAG: cytochrome c [Proteobacteria bacterium]|nr:cytochrome c [Pseudomonadota bacterium]
MMKRTVLAVAAFALGLSVAAAQDPIAARKALMKATGAQAGLGAKMARGEEPFDLAKAKAIFAQYEKTSAEAKSLFPDTAMTGGETAAMPAIWKSKPDFEAKLAKLGADAKAASGKVTDLATFKAEFPLVQKNCGGCHEDYRAKKS